MTQDCWDHGGIKEPLNQLNNNWKNTENVNKISMKLKGLLERRFERSSSGVNSTKLLPCYELADNFSGNCLSNSLTFPFRFSWEILLKIKVSTLRNDNLVSHLTLNSRNVLLLFVTVFPSSHFASFSSISEWTPRERFSRLNVSSMPFKSIEQQDFSNRWVKGIRETNNSLRNITRWLRKQRKLVFSSFAPHAVEWIWSETCLLQQNSFNHLWPSPGGSELNHLFELINESDL